MPSVRSKRSFAPWTDPAERPLLRIEDLSKRFGGSAAVDKLSLDIYQGEFFALLGPSGCGKTTLLRLIAGFERPDSGRIMLDGVDLVSVPPYRRPVNMMFQNYALFPHLNVEANVAFGLKQEGLPKAEIAQRAADMLAMANLESPGPGGGAAGRFGEWPGRSPAGRAAGAARQEAARPDALRADGPATSARAH